MLKYEIKDKPLEQKLAGLFPKHKISVLYGNSGIGKTVSVAKALNLEGITPILFDFDDNPVSSEVGCEYILIDGNSTLVRNEDITSFKDGIEVPTDRVIIIDTWNAFNAWFYSELDAIRFIQDYFIGNSNTVIIIDHSKDMATRRDIPSMDETLVNHLAAKLWLREPKAKETAKYRVLEIKKLRGSNATKIVGWMENTIANSLVKQIRKNK